MRGERGEGNHFGEGGGVHACLVCFADIGHTLIGMGNKAIDERRLTHAAVAAEEGNLAFEQGAQLLYALPCRSRDGPALITNGLIEVHHHLLVVQLFVGEYVHLIKYKYHGYAIGLGGCQETVDERGGGLRTADGDDEQCLIDVGSEDVALLGEVDALADDVVAAVFDFRYPTSYLWSLTTHLYGDAVAHGHRIGRAYSLDAEIALHFTIKELAIVRQDGVPASSILNDKSLQYYTVMISLFLASISSSSFLMYLS